MAEIELPASTHTFSRADRSRLGLWWWTVDHWLLGAALALIGLGVLLSFGSSPAAASRLDIAFPFHFAVRQSIYAVIGRDERQRNIIGDFGHGLTPTA